MTMPIILKSAPMPELPVSRLMADVARDSKISILRQFSEIIRLSRGASALSMYEYYYYKLFSPVLCWEEKQKYIGTTRTQALYLLANKLTWWDAAEDKLAFHYVMSGMGYPVPELYAVAHPRRRHRLAQHLPDIEATRSWLKSLNGPVFGKPLVGSHGIGTIRISGKGSELDTLVSGEGVPFGIDDLVAEISGYVEGAGYMWQEELTPHPDISRLTGGRVASMRVVVIVDSDGPRALDTIFRIPSGGNGVDNFRQPGNLVARLDPQTGKPGPVMRGVSVYQETLHEHPDTAVPFAQLTVPLVAEAIELATSASAAFPGLHVQSWDIVPTEKGLRILEMNPGGNFNLLQLARNEGALSPEFREFMRWCNSLHLNPKTDNALKLASRLAA